MLSSCFEKTCAWKCLCHVTTYISKMRDGGDDIDKQL